MEIQHFRHLVAASESSSFAKAAKKCFTSRQNIAHSVKVIENRLGVALFERRGNEMILTPEGAEAVGAYHCAWVVAVLEESIHAKLAQRLAWSMHERFHEGIEPCSIIRTFLNTNPRNAMPKELIVVHGPCTISGTIHVSGAKNSALKLMAASILGQGTTTIHNIPNISDISVMSDVLTRLGARISREGHTFVIDTTEVNSFETPYELVSKMRASISVLGPLIARFGCARVAMPGGCQIGARKIDMHLVGLEALGVQFDVDHGILIASTPAGLIGAHVMLEFPSVGATENMLMAAVVAEGETVIDNAAREPEIVDLCNMLNQMGAKVSGGGTSSITIEGVPLDSLHPCEHTTVGDRIEAGTFLTGGALTGGPLQVTGIDPDYLKMAIMKLRAFGCTVETDSSSITVSRTGDLQPTDIQTLPHPGFPTDLQAQFMLLAALADGVSVITENLFENRFMFAAELMRMGADITLEEHHAIIRGVAHLQGAPVSATDLRAGAALVLAGAVADGTTWVHDIEHIDRGYEDYVGKLSCLGVDLERTVEA